VALVLGGLGFPIPEDVPLLFGGVAISKGLVHQNVMFVVCYAGVLIGDQIMFFIGHRYGNRMLQRGTRSRFLPMITEDRIQEVRDGLRRKRLLYIFIGRHLFPLRSVTFVTAGALRIPFLEFFVADAIAAFVSVCLMLFLGFWLGETLTPERIEHFSQEANTYIVITAILLIMGFASHYLWKRRKLRQRVEQQKEPVVDDALSSHAESNS